MGRSTRKIPRDRTPQWKLDALIEQSDYTQSEQLIIERDKVSPHPVLFSHEEYDTLHPESLLSGFCKEIRNMLMRYEGNKARLEELENEMQDILHYIELTENKNANIGFKLYKRLTEVRRERRICKNEINLLQPIYDNFKESDLLNVLSRIQGSCGSIKRQIDGRAYTVRTDVLDPFIKP